MWCFKNIRQNDQVKSTEVNSVEEQIMNDIVLALWARGFPSRTEIRTGDASNSRLLPRTISSKKLPAALDIPSIIRQNGR